MPTHWDCGAADRCQDADKKLFNVFSTGARGCGVRLQGGWHSSRVLGHRAKIPGQGVAQCRGTFEMETIDALELLRSEFNRKRCQRSSNKNAANVRATELRNEAAARIENDAQRSSSSRASASHEGVRSIAAALMLQVLPMFRLQPLSLSLVILCLSILSLRHVLGASVWPSRKHHGGGR